MCTLCVTLSNPIYPSKHTHTWHNTRITRSNPIYSLCVFGFSLHVWKRPAKLVSLGFGVVSGCSYYYPEQNIRLGASTVLVKYFGVIQL